MTGWWWWMIREENVWIDAKIDEDDDGDDDDDDAEEMGKDGDDRVGYEDLTMFLHTFSPNTHTRTAAATTTTTAIATAAVIIHHQLGVMGSIEYFLFFFSFFFLAGEVVVSASFVSDEGKFICCVSFFLSLFLALKDLIESYVHFSDLAGFLFERACLRPTRGEKKEKRYHSFFRLGYRPR